MYSWKRESSIVSRLLENLFYISIGSKVETRKYL